MTRRPEWLDRVLGADDLDPAARNEVEAWLADHPDARRLLDRIRAIEAGEEDPLGTLPSLEIAARELAGPERAEAERSLAQLAERLERSGSWRTARVPSRDRDELSHGGLLDRMRRAWSALAGAPAGVRLVPVAAAAAVALFFLTRPDDRTVRFDDRPVLGELVVRPASRVRGGDPDGVPDTTAARVWRTGETFVLRCPVDRPVVPVLLHLDPGGRLELLHPERVTGPYRVHRPDRLLELPEPESGVEWVLEGGAGTETFLLAAAPEESDLAAVMPGVLEEARALATPDVERDEAIRRLTKLLEERVGEVRLTEIRHGD
jgi:hypothetical protein